MQVIPEPASGTPPTRPTSPTPLVWLEVNLLGPFEVKAHIAGSESEAATSRPVHCTSNAALLLAYLALHSSRRITRDHLATQLYPDHTVEEGRKKLSQAVYHLQNALDEAIPQRPRVQTTLTRRSRKVQGDSADLGTDLIGNLILITPDTLGLAPNSAVVDVHLFRREAKSAHLEDWQRAIQRYRGDLLSEWEPEWALVDRATLIDSYKRVLAQACSAISRSGRLPEALDLARQWIAADEFNEEAHRALMRLAAQSHQYAVALKHFEDLSKLMQAEFGNQPDIDTRRLAQRIRAESQAGLDEDDLDALPFVGRRAERTRVLQAALGALKAQGQLVLLEGESGIGKSRLLDSVADAADWRGMQVVWGQAQQHSTGQLYAPLNQALQHALTPSRLSAIRATLPATVLDILSHFVPALHNAPEAKSSVNAEPNLRLVAPTDAIQQLLAALSAQMPLLLILDDVQWADAGFWEAIRMLAPALSAQSLSVILSYRDDEVRANPTAWDTLQALDESLNPTLIRLTGLTPAECVALATSLRKQPVSPAEATHLYQQTHGNPLFIEGLVEGQPNATFPKQVAVKLERLTPPARRALECAAVLGREFDHVTWQVMVAPDDVIKVVPELVNARHIHDTPHGYAFRHDMLREQVYEGIAQAQRRELHRRAAAVLRSQQAEPSLLALHLEQAGQWQDAIRAYRFAGNRAESADAHASALQHYAHAFRLLNHLSPQQARFEQVKLLCRRQLVYGMQLRLDEWRADIEKLEALAQSLGERLSLITAYEARMTLSLFASDPEGTRQAGERALALAKTTRRRDVEARIGNILGMHLAGLLRQVDRALPLLNRSADYAQSVKDNSLLVSVLCNLSLAQRLQGHCRAARDTAVQALSLSESQVSVTSARAARAAALHALGCADWYLLNWNEALESLNQAVQAQIELNNMWRAAEALASLAHLYISMGQYADVLRAAERLLELGRAIGVSPQSDVWHWVQAIWADAQTLAGNFDTAGEVLKSIDTWLQVTADSRYALIGLQARGRWQLEQQQPHAALQTLKRAHRIWQQRKHAELEPVLLFILAAHRSGQSQIARDTLAEVTHYAQSGDGQLHQVLLQAVTHEVCGDVANLYAAHDALQVQAGKLNSSMRENLISGVRLHREVLQSYREVRQAQPLQPRAESGGVQTVRLARIGVPIGRPLIPADQVDVIWTVDDGVSDTLVQRREGKAGLRNHRIQRLVREAYDQGAMPTYTDLARALKVSVRTIERDISRLRDLGVHVHTRGDKARGIS